MAEEKSFVAAAPVTAVPVAGRVVCHFSCGAASAVAAKIALKIFGPERVLILNAYIKEEHADNRRFLADCEKWFNHPVTVIADERYGASVDTVWTSRRFIANGLFGASCSSSLKHDVLDAACLPGDLHVLGFTADQGDLKRAQKFMDAGAVCPLIERGLSKADCLAIVERAGIELPIMYRLGFNNANCVGCCKGGEGYWNKIRVVFPERFAQVAAIQQDLGPGSYFFRNRKTGERISLLQLLPDAGRHDEPVPDCSLFCQMAEYEMDFPAEG